MSVTLVSSLLDRAHYCERPAERAVRTFSCLPDGLPPQMGGHADLHHTTAVLACSLMNAMDAATETHLCTERLEDSGRTLLRVQTCEAQAACTRQWQVKRAGAAIITRRNPSLGSSYANVVS
jgi:hypothetical protein